MIFVKGFLYGALLVMGVYWMSHGVFIHSIFDASIGAIILGLFSGIVNVDINGTRR